MRGMCLLGATDTDLARALGVSVATISNWKNQHPEFLEALKEGKDFADAKVAMSLYRRATGYTVPDVHVSNYQGQVTLTPIKKHYPPDPTSMIFWLKNRRPDFWRDKPGEGAPVGDDEGLLRSIAEKLPD